VFFAENGQCKFKLTMAGLGHFSEPPIFNLRHISTALIPNLEFFLQALITTDIASFKAGKMTAI